jgi:hypothetical protein
MKNKIIIYNMENTKEKLTIKEIETVMVNAHGTMVHFMRVTGLMEKEVGLEYFLKKMDTNTKVNGKMTKNMEKVKFFFKMDMKLLVIGNLIN